MTRYEMLICMMGVLIIVIIVSLIHPVFDVHNKRIPTPALFEAFQGDSDSQVIVETVYKYQGGKEWSRADSDSWQVFLKNSYNSFNDIQSDIQDIYKQYVNTESQLEQSARKKHTHWLTMTPDQRAKANMIDDPIHAYYAPITNQSKKPLGGLKDNEGNLPYGIPNVSLPPSEGTSAFEGGIEFDWTPGSDSEARFYKQSRDYTNMLNTALQKLTNNVDLLTWSTNGNQSASLLPRIKTLQANAEKKKEELAKHKGNISNQQKALHSKSSEGFKTDTPERIQKRVVTIDVYPVEDAREVMNTTHNTFQMLRKQLTNTREDIIQASRILKQLDEQGQATQDKLKNAAMSKHT